VSYRSLLFGERCADIYARVLEHLGVSCPTGVAQEFVYKFANNAYAASLERKPLNETDEALARATPFEAFVEEIDRKGVCLANQSETCLDTLKSANSNPGEVFARLGACLAAAHPDARNPRRYRGMTDMAMLPRIAFHEEGSSMPKSVSGGGGNL
jgi:hypothetical protein